MTKERDESRIMTLHPAGKQGVRIDRGIYEAVKAGILKLVPATPEGRPLQEVRELLPALLEPPAFPASASPVWYLIAVKQDLQARGLIELVPGKQPQYLRVVQGVVQGVVQREE